MKKSIINNIWIFIIPLVAFLFLYTFVQFYFANWYTHSNYYIVVFSFLFAALVFYKLIKGNSFYSTFRHELCHWLISILCFNKPKGFNVSANGSGHFVYEGKNNIFINLAPYYLPISSLFVLLLQFLMYTKPFWYYILIGFAFAFDVVSAAKDYKTYQTDWKESGGALISIVFSISMALMISISLFTVLFRGIDGLGSFFYKVWIVISNLM